jgi:hypothetical protein
MYHNYGLEFMLDVMETIPNASKQDSNCIVRETHN